MRGLYTCQAVRQSNCRVAALGVGVGELTTPRTFSHPCQQQHTEAVTPTAVGVDVLKFEDDRAENPRCASLRATRARMGSGATTRACSRARCSSGRSRPRLCTLLGAAPVDHAARPLSFRAAVKVQLARVRLLEPVARRRRLELTPSWRRTLAKPLCQARMAMQHGNRPSCSSFCLGTYRKS